MEGRKYRITARCIGCRHCAIVCPYRAVEGFAAPLIIKTSLCRGCGKCAKECPLQAIIVSW